MAMPDGKIVRARAVQPKPEGMPTAKASLGMIASGPAGGSAVITQKTSGPTRKAEDVTPGASESDPVPRGFGSTKTSWTSSIIQKGALSVKHSGEVTENTKGTTAKDVENGLKNI